MRPPACARAVDSSHDAVSGCGTNGAGFGCRPPPLRASVVVIANGGVPTAAEVVVIAAVVEGRNARASATRLAVRQPSCN
jgi:hypothetical protein